MKIAYKNKWSTWNNNYFKIYLVTPNDKKEIEEKLGVVNRILKKPAKIINNLPKVDNKVIVNSEDTIVEFGGLYKVGKYKEFKKFYKTYKTNEEFENFRISQINLILLSIMNYLDKKDDLLLIFSYNHFWYRNKKNNSVNYEIGYISSYPKIKLQNNVNKYNDNDKLIEENKYQGCSRLSPLIQYEECIHSMVEIIEDDNSFRSERTIRIINKQDSDYIDLGPNKTYIKTALLAEYNYNTKEFIYNLDEVKRFISENIEKSISNEENSDEKGSNPN